MNWTKYLLPILKQTDFLLAGISLLLIVFYRFFIKAQFSKNANLKWYAMLMYSFVGLVVSCISFIILNAQTKFFNLHSVYKTYWFFGLYIVLTVAVCFIISWLIYNATQLVNISKSFLLTNYSLIIIAPTLMYVLLFKPFIDNFEYTGIKKPEVFIGSNQAMQDNFLFNPNDFIISESKPKIYFTPAIPFQLFDSLNLTLENNASISYSLGGSFLFKHNFKLKNIEQVYVSAFDNYLILLGVTNDVYGLSSLLIIDHTGNMVFQKIYRKQVNRMAVNAEKKVVLLSQFTANNTNTFIESIFLYQIN